MRILYAENHAIFADNVVRKFLSNHSVIIVPSLALARRALTEKESEVLLVDFDLDDGKGDALAREVRERNPHTTVIDVSSHDEGNEALRRAGANAICSKMQFGQIQSLIEKAVQNPV